MSQETTQKKVGLGLAFKRVAKGAAALGAVGALVLGGASVANADVTGGHVDAVSINAANDIGSKFDSTHASWPLSASDSRFVFSGGGVSCTGGVYSIASFPATAPSVGFNNDAGTGKNSYVIALDAVTSGQSAAFDGPGSQDLNTSGTDLTLAAGGHIHGSWTLNSGTGSCATGGVDFPLEFSAEEIGGSANYDDQVITFRVVI